MTPTIVARDGKLFMVTGSPGGRTIINTVLHTVLNVLDFGMDAQEAVDAPRFHHQWLPDRTDYERLGLSPDTVEILEGMGHALGAIGGAGHRRSDPRRSRATARSRPAVTGGRRTVPPSALAGDELRWRSEGRPGTVTPGQNARGTSSTEARPSRIVRRATLGARLKRRGPAAPGLTTRRPSASTTSGRCVCP